MVRIVGPLFSIAASGTYRGCILFKTRQGSTFAAGPPAVPASRSALQRAHAAAVGVMASFYTSLSVADRAAWDLSAGAAGIPTYRHYWREWFAQGSSSSSPPSPP